MNGFELNRRDVARLGVASGAAMAAATASLSVWAQPRKPEDGVDYISLEKPAKVEAPAHQIEVIEFFWYKCVHCNRFEPDLERWVAKLPKDVAFRRVPAAFRDDFVPQQRLFYALESMGLVEKMHRKVFAAIHEQKVNLDGLEQIAAWLETQGVDKAKFTSNYESFTVQTKATKASQLQRAFNVSGVPSMGVAGRFYTDGALAQTMDRALQTVDFLIAQQRLSKPGLAKAKTKA